MKIILALLLCSATLLRAEPEDSENEPPDPNNPPAEVELTPAEREALDLIDKGDASALKGEQEDAMSFWDEALTHKGAGDRQMQDARERLQWACPDNGIGGLGSDKPGQAFAVFRRNAYLGADEKLRKNFIREFCEDSEHNDPHPEFKAYAEWLQKMLPEDQNFELLPLLLEGDLAENHFWLSQNMPEINNYDFPANPELTLQVVKLLSGAKTEGRFVATMFDENGNQTLMAKIIDCLSRDDDHEQKRYERTRVMLKKFLAGIRTPTLDSDLMLVLLNRNDEKALAVFMKKHGVKMAAFEPEELKAMLSILESVKGCPKTQEMNNLLHRGDASALAGDRDAAKALWGQVMTITPAGIVPRQDAMERLAWARPKNGVESWKPKTAGQAFANFMRDHFLGADAPQREAMIKDFCANQDRVGEVTEKFNGYAEWLSNMLADDKNLELVPFMIEGGLANNQQWLSLTLRNVKRYNILKDPARAIKLLQGLGFLGEAQNFRTLPLDHEGKLTVMGTLIDALQKVARTDDAPTGNALREQLRELQPRTFGNDLALALLDQNENKALAEFLAKHRADFASLKENHRREALDAITRDLAGYPNTEDMDAAVVNGLRALLPEGVLKSEKLEDRLLAILSPDNVEKTDGRKIPSVDEAAQLLINASQKHRDNAANGLNKALDLLKKCPSQNDPNVFPWETPAAYLVKSLFYNPKTFSMALRVATEAGYLNDPEMGDRVCHALWTCFSNDQGNMQYGKLSGDQVVEYFFPPDSIFLSEAENFQPAVPTIGGTMSFDSILEGVVHLIDSNDSIFVNRLRLPGKNLNKDVLEILSTRKPTTFGLEIVMVLLAKNDKETLEFIHRRAEDFPKIPPERRTSVLKLLSKAWKPLENPEKLDPEIRSLLKPIIDPDPSHWQQQAQRFLTANSLLELKLSKPSCMKSALELVDHLSQTDIGKAMKLVSATGQLILHCPGDSPEANQWQYKKWRILAATIPELFVCITREEMERNEPVTTEWMDSVEQASGFIATSERLLKIFDSDFFSGDASHFRTFSYDDQRSFLSSLVNKFRKNTQTKALLSNYLEKHKQTFGVELVKTLLERKPDGMLRFISGHGTELLGMPVAHHLEIARLAGVRFGGLLQLADVSPEWNKALQPILPSLRNIITKECDGLLRLEKIEDMLPHFSECDWHQFDTNYFHESLTTVSEMMLIDPKKGQETYGHLLRLSIKADSRDGGKIGVVSHFLNWSARYPTLALPFLGAAKNDGVVAEDMDEAWNGWLLQMSEKPLDLFCMMQSVGFLADSEKFDASLPLAKPSWLNNEEGDKPASTMKIPVKDYVYFAVLKYLTDSDFRRQRKRFLDYLSKRQQRTFGIDLMQALMNDKPSKTVPEFYKTHAADFARLSQASREPVEILLRSVWPEMPKLTAEKMK